MGKAPSVAKFSERWPLACFALPSRYFGLLGGGEIRSGEEGSQFVEKRHLSPISGEGGLQPIVNCQPARSSKGRFLAVSPGLLLAVSPGVFSGSVIRYFVSGLWSWLSWLCDQGIVLDSDRLLQSSPAARRNGKGCNNIIIINISYLKKRSELHISYVLGLPYYTMLNSTCKKSVINR